MENVYEQMRKSGILGLVLGIVIICAGVMSTVSGSFIIASGVKLLKKKDNLTF